MDSKELRSLQEAYNQVYQELDESSRGGNDEQVDFYDIILSHLLDEGYAETPEAAEAIMVNMSEDWRESIIEEAPKRIKLDPPNRRLMKDAGPARVHNPNEPKKAKRV